MNVTDELKQLYKTDSTPKTYTIYFPGLDLTITNTQLVQGNFDITEDICSDKDLKYGSCIASQVKFTVADVTQDLKGKLFTVTQTMGEYVVPIGTYVVDSCTKQNNLRFKDIIAYDAIQKTDIDVSAWYNSLFPTGNETYVLSQFRTLLLLYLGIDKDTTNLPLRNDSMIVPKTISPTQLSGRTVLQACEELNGCFGHINSEGKFTHIILKPAYGLYPSDTLYPSEDLYPVSEYDASFTQPDFIAETITKSMYRENGVKFEEYSVKEISKLQIRQEEGDIGVVVGDDIGHIVETKTGTSLQSTKAEDAKIRVTKIEGASYQKITSQGKNLIDNKAVNTALNGVTYTINADKTITATGIRTGTSYIALLGSLSNSTTVFTLKVGIAYYPYYNTIKYKTTSGSYGSIPTTGFTPTQDINCVCIYYEVEANTTLPRTAYPMLTSGAMPTAYEQFIPNSPSVDYPSPIINASNFYLVASDGTNSNRVNIPYEMPALNTIEIGEDGKTRIIKRKNSILLSGKPEEIWTYNSSQTNTARFDIVPMTGGALVDRNKIKCDKFNPLYGDVSDTEHIRNGDARYPANLALYINKTRLSGWSESLTNTQKISLLKIWLASNPITVQYEQTPIETIIDDIYLTSYKGTATVTSTANPQVNITADFMSNTDNTYTITGNFLVYGKSGAELEQIANNAFINMKSRPYRPFASENIGLPYVQIGDMVKFDTDDPVVGYVLQRTLTGIQSLKDQYTAEGSETITESTGLSTQITQLQGKVAKVVRTIDEVSSTMSDLAEATESKFLQTSDEISLEVSRAKDTENEISGKIDVLAGQVVIKVDAAGNFALVELDADPSTGSSIKLSADNIDLTGYVTLESLSGEGTTTINGSNIKTGSITGVNFINVNSDNTEVATIKNGAFLGTSFKSYEYNAIEGGSVGILTGVLSPGHLAIGNGVAFTNIDGAVINTSTINCTSMYINGSMAVTFANVGQQTCYMAQSCYYLPSNWKYALETNINYLFNVIEQSLRYPWPAD